ncbi:unnamed protein product, partial [Allacma fusca]
FVASLFVITSWRPCFNICAYDKEQLTHTNFQNNSISRPSPVGIFWRLCVYRILIACCWPLPCLCFLCVCPVHLLINRALP